MTKLYDEVRLVFPGLTERFFKVTPFDPDVDVQRSSMFHSVLEETGNHCDYFAIESSKASPGTRTWALYDGAMARAGRSMRESLILVAEFYEADEPAVRPEGATPGGPTFAQQT